jgi:enoyl-CoA hydratase/carnithine racemase
MESERVVVTREGGVAHVEMTREDRFNALDHAAFEAVGGTFRTLGADPSVRAIVLSGRGRHFTAGIDLHYAAGLASNEGDPARAAEARLRNIFWLQEAFSAVEQARVPVVAAVHGGCIGAGVDLVCACDLRIVASDGYFQVAEVDVAITADLGTLQRLSYLIPGGVVRELAYTGRRMGAEEAQRFGFANRVVDGRETAIAAALELARMIAAKSPLAVAGTKMSLNHSRGRPIEEGLKQVALWNAATLASPDLGAAIEARRGKSDPGFADLEP